MADSARKRIIEYIRDTTLPLITVGGGYNNTIENVERGIRNLDRLSDHEFPILFIPGAREAREDQTKIHFNSLMSVFISGYVKDDEGTQGAVQGLLDDLIEDVTKAFYIDETLGGNAVNLTVVDVDPEDSDDGTHGFVLMRIDVQYQSVKATP